jgi:transcription elongation factor Elf1
MKSKEASYKRDKNDSSRMDVTCGNCKKATNLFIIDYDTGFVEGIYFTCPHCGEVNRLYSV